MSAPWPPPAASASASSAEPAQAPAVAAGQVPPQYVRHDWRALTAPAPPGPPIAAQAPVPQPAVGDAAQAAAGRAAQALTQTRPLTGLVDNHASLTGQILAQGNQETQQSNTIKVVVILAIVLTIMVIASVVIATVVGDDIIAILNGA